MKHKAHFLYIVGILLAIIIILVTYKFGDNDKLIDYLKFGLTITSLFLALIAIIYSFISNSTISNNLSTIDLPPLVVPVIMLYSPIKHWLLEGEVSPPVPEVQILMNYVV